MEKLNHHPRKIGRDRNMLNLLDFFKKTHHVFWLSLLVTLKVMGQQVEVEVSPSEAIANESFYLTFKVKMSGSGEPYISFTPVNAEVLNRKEQGVSISTVVINGKFTTTREQSYVYELISDRTGTAYIKNIAVELNGKTEKLKDLRINVLGEKRKLQDVFLEAQPSKNKIYVGEGINVNYYLYYKIPVIANDIKEFPKLNKFIKRFYKTNGNVETVQYKGEVYRRVLAYAARSYPEKPGIAVLDSMRISAQVADQRSFDPFGGLSNSYRQKDISSPRVEIEVMPIPTEGMPSNFTGLVGNHEFQLTGGKEKYLINEPIEFKLEVKGSGALENFQAPSLFNSDLIEEFDAKTDLAELAEGLGSKKFEFTYLARSEITIPEREVSFSVFDPDKKIFIEKKIRIPTIKVAGGAAPVKNDNKKNQLKSKENTKGINLAFDLNFMPDWLKPIGKKGEDKLGLVGLDFTATSTSAVPRFLGLSITLFLLGFLVIWFELRKSSTGEDTSKIFEYHFKNFKKNPTYENLYLLVSHSLSNNLSNNGPDIIKALKQCSLSNDSKNYILSLMGSLEQSQFAKSSSSVDVKKINYGHLKSLKKIMKEQNEAH